ncbi:MAG TPA: MATE family efflux transporter [Caulobacteraceae bacterium]|jgi:MATE family multidrug resistance protein|nr:MATE family efflux transporter [Caulobacteraceae bacterium]
MAAESVITAPPARATVRYDLVELLKLAWPVVLARVGIMTMGFTDAAVVGHHSARQLGFHSIGWAPTSVVLTTAVGLLLGVQVMTARHVGEGRPHAAGGVLRRGLVYGLGLGILSVIVVVIAGPPFLHLSMMGLSPDLADGASSAMLVFAWSLPGYFVATVAMYFLEALKKPIPGMVVMWLANGLNLALDLWLVPGHSGLPVMGAVAAAWATLFSRLFMAVVLLSYILLMPQARALGVFGKPIDGPVAAAEQRRVGYGSGASMFLEIGAFAAMTLIAGQLGGLQAAAWATILNVAAMVFMVPLGLSSATAVLVGRAFGARDHDGVSRAGFLGFGVTTALLALICAAIGLFAGAVARIYTLDATLLAMIAPALVLSCLFYVPDGLQVVGAQALRARGDVWLPTVFHLASYAVIMVPLAWVLAHRTPLGLDGIVWSVILASFVSGALQVGRFAWLALRPLTANPAP